jgi:hypothetical protein
MERGRHLARSRGERRSGDAEPTRDIVRGFVQLIVEAHFPHLLGTGLLDNRASHLLPSNHGSRPYFFMAASIRSTGIA